MFNTLLEDAGIDPFSVRLLRHHTSKPGRRTPFELWRDSPDEFEQRYQRTQDPEARAYFNSKYWASFVSPANDETLFVGLFEIKRISPVPDDWIDPISGLRPGIEKGRVYDLYNCTPIEALANYRGGLKIAWGSAPKHWRQKAGNQNKQVVELVQTNIPLQNVTTPEAVTRLEAVEHGADPTRKKRISTYIERGPVGGLVKAARRGRCQICEALGAESIAFTKKDGSPFSEAHHVFPVAKLRKGSLSAQNIMVLCPNHHREVHYGDFEVKEYHAHRWLVRLGQDLMEISKTEL